MHRALGRFGKRSRPAAARKAADSRTLTERLRPPCRAGGIIGSTIAYCQRLRRAPSLRALISYDRRARSPTEMDTIDDALMLSGGKIPTIRHTHAEILFDANITLAHTDKSARAELRKSLSILEDCRTYDRRKSYHAFKFSEEACNYYDAYMDIEATEYLKKAESWLEEELKNPFSVRRARFHLRDV